MLPSTIYLHIIKQSSFTSTTAAQIALCCKNVLALLEIEHFGIITPHCCKAMFHCLKGISPLDCIKVYYGLHFKDIQTFRLLKLDIFSTQSLLSH